MSATVLEIKPVQAIPDFLIGEMRAKMAYVDEAVAGAQVALAGNLITLQLKRALGESEQALIEQKVQRVVVAMVKGAFKLKVQVLEDFLDRPVLSAVAEDPTNTLLARGELSREATGIYVLGPLLTRLVAFFEHQFVDLASSFQAEPYRFPTLIPARYLERVDYFSAFPHSLTFATHLRSDLDVIDHFASHAACDEHGLTTSMESFSGVETLLSPAVCYHLYFSLADRPLPSGQVVATAVGNCFRYESTNLTSLERMWNFTMREIIFVGPKDFVLANRETARQRMSEKFAGIGLAYRVESANDPFFIGEFKKQAAFQSAFQLKYEIRARLPFKDSTLAVGSYNYHQDFFGRKLNMTLPDGSPAHTGCVAFGLERMAYAFLSQFGLDPAAWPEQVRRAIA
ncbi:MAG: hypothetical protein FJZ96_10900 [Chloroflexi bacterium]|nr:hypothetical protein [Chloroflexota bacterium]